MGIIGWTLWRALNKPPRRHPLFEYVLLDAYRSETRVTSGFFMWAFMVSSVLFFWMMVFDWVLYLLLFLLIAINSIYSLRWAVRISRTIVEEKANKRFDLLASLPLGTMGTSWAISLGCVHRRASFRTMPYLILLTAFVVMLTLIFMLSTTLIVLDNVSINEQALIQNLNMIQVAIIGMPFIILFYVDHLYAIMTAVLIGQIVTVDQRDTAEAQVQSGLLFIALQMATYIMSCVFGIWILPYLIGLFEANVFVALLLTAVVGSGVYIAIREWLIKRLWQLLQNVFDADENEIKLVLSGIDARA